MTRDVDSVLASQFDQYEVRRLIHRERPHATWEVTVDGQRATCKVATTDEMCDVGAEAAVFDYVDAATDVPVPSVLAAEPDAFVLAWADGLPEPDEMPEPEDMPAAEARALGAVMARLHEATADQFSRPGFVRYDGDDSGVLAGTDDSRSSGPDDSRYVAGDDGRCFVPEDGRYLAVDERDDSLTVVRDFLRSHRAYHAEFGWADPADEVLALLEDRPNLFDGAGTPVLCHGNAYPEHLGFEGEARTDPDAVTAVVDFEHALVAPAEYDFWRTGLPVFHTKELEPLPQFSAYREGYESVRSLPLGVERRKEAWLLVNSVSYLTSLAVEHDGIDEDHRHRAEGTSEWVAELVATIRDRNP